MGKVISQQKTVSPKEEIYLAYRGLVLAIISQPRPPQPLRISSKGVAEIMRSGFGGKSYPINNTDVSGLAHRFVEEFPEYSIYFSFRRSPHKAAAL